MSPSEMPIIIMGVSGSGKSTIGTILARRVGAQFIEGDTLHSPENVAKMHAGVPLDDADRWPWLDRIGRTIIEQLQTADRVIVTCSALKRAYRERLESIVGPALRFVLLDVDREELVRRLTRRRGHYMPASLLDSQLAVLEPPGEDEHAIVVRASDGSPEDVARKIAERLTLPAE